MKRKLLCIMMILALGMSIVNSSKRGHMLRTNGALSPF